MSKVKVLQVNKLYAPHIGGVETVVQNIAEGLIGRFDMKVLVCRERGKASVEVMNGVNITRAGSLGIYYSMPLSFSFFTYLRKLSQDRDIIQFHMPFPLGDAAYFLSGFKGKVIVWWHSDIVRQKSLMKVYKPLMNKFLNRADCIIVATEGHVNSSEYLSPYRSKCVVIPYGIDINTVTEDAEKSIRPDKSLPESNIKKVLFIGRLIYYKGIEVLIDAFQNVKGAQLIIAGDGPLRKQLEGQVFRLGISDNVVFTGNVDSRTARSLLHNCDMLVLPSIASSEAFGLVQLEAMACSKPVINTNLPTGVPYVSIHGQTGITVPPGDSGALGKAMQTLIDHDDMRLQMGNRAKERVIKHFNMDDMLQKLSHLYENI